MMIFSGLSLWEFAGLLGATLYILSYALAALDVVPSNSPSYYMLKLFAALLVLTSLSNSFNLSAAVIQVFFILISLVGLLRHLHVAGRKRVEMRRTAIR